ncbi:Sel1 domain repeat-containing protein [Campylobacter pinnipediorum subsp. pinnipediorum]|uniref:tetratricopeptide repeat protein n=1 Tax=Campylobacter pinnipediorum TaxID=1965231 RepID=UPI000995C142|nr:tetratricopeptide repeat protein [Campylobacter pinnipediorum]AQW83938.1 Sel1 domain repeat-containing protein [Campylobacter pinnipediorum subsp. pinnipediorum]
MKKIVFLFVLSVFCFGMGANDKLAGGVKPSEDVVLDKEYEKSAKIFKESCEKGNMYNCYNLGKFYSDGRGVIQSDINALKYFQISCDGRLPYGCFMLGEIFYNQKDFEKAVNNYSLSCDYGDDKGCLKLAEAYYAGEGVAKDLSKARDLSQKACQMGNDKACMTYENLKQQQ